MDSCNVWWNTARIYMALEYADEICKTDYLGDSPVVRMGTLYVGVIFTNEELLDYSLKLPL